MNPYALRAYADNVRAQRDRLRDVLADIAGRDPRNVASVTLINMAAAAVAGVASWRCPACNRRSDSATRRCACCGRVRDVLGDLRAELAAWCAAEGLAPESADDLLRVNCDARQSAWLRDYIARWDAAVAATDIVQEPSLAEQRAMGVQS